MEKFDAGELLGRVHHIATLGHQLPSAPPLQKMSLEGGTYDDQLKVLNDLLPQLRALGLESSHRLGIRLREIMLRATDILDPKIPPGKLFRGKDWNGLKDTMEELWSRVKDELSGKMIFSLPDRNSRQFEAGESIFGKDCLERFPSAAFEIDEAAKCLALERSTASVFHLMRVMEIGIAAVRRSLGIPDPVKAGERNWGFILKKVKDEIDRRSRITPAQWGRFRRQQIFLGGAYFPRCGSGMFGEIVRCTSRTSILTMRRSTY